MSKPKNVIVAQSGGPMPVINASLVNGLQRFIRSALVSTEQKLPA